MGHQQAAVDFLRLVVSRRIDEAYDKYIDMRGKHHNPYFSPGFAALKKGMIEAHTKFPDTTIHIRHVLEDGEFVAVHSNVVLTPGEAGIAVVHLFRFNGEKVVEMWDVAQQVPAESPNIDGAF
jgi:predicted SnoaL-like aldol condensation-catalyzing enzyme